MPPKESVLTARDVAVLAPIRSVAVEQLLLALRLGAWDAASLGPPPQPHPLLAPLTPATFLVVDVRGSDRARYGWIEGSVNLPVDKLDRAALVALCHRAAADGKRALVLHCLHSKHRAVFTLHELQRVVAGAKLRGEACGDAGVGAWPQLLLLHGGFSAWLARWALPAPELCVGTPSEKIAAARRGKPWQQRPAGRPVAASAHVDALADCDVADAATVPVS